MVSIIIALKFLSEKASVGRGLEISSCSACYCAGNFNFGDANSKASPFDLQCVVHDRNVLDGTCLLLVLLFL